MDKSAIYKELGICKEVLDFGEKIAESFSDSDSSRFDPDGSWTGTPKDKNDKPIQDADDL